MAQAGRQGVQRGDDGWWMEEAREAGPLVCASELNREERSERKAEGGGKEVRRGEREREKDGGVDEAQAEVERKREREREREEA